MAFIYDPDVAYTCGFGSSDSDDVSVCIGHEVTEEGETFSFEFVDGALSIRCSRALAAEIASAFASVAEA